MENLGIFVFGVAVFLVVATACLLIGWGIVIDRRGRERDDAEAEALGAGQVPAATAKTGETRAVR